MLKSKRPFRSIKKHDEKPTNSHSSTYIVAYDNTHSTRVFTPSPSRLHDSVTNAPQIRTYKMKIFTFTTQPTRRSNLIFDIYRFGNTHLPRRQARYTQQMPAWL